MALADPVVYLYTYPNCDPRLADCNADGVTDFDDINAFVGILGGG